MSDSGGSDRGAGATEAESVTALVLAVTVVIFVVVTVLWLPFVVRAFDYNGAYRCSSTPNVACYTEVPDVVQSVGTDGYGKNAVAFIVLRDAGKFDLTSFTGLWSAAHAGDAATVRIYHGVAATVEVRGFTAETPHNPDLSSKHVTGFEVAAVGALLFGLSLYGRERWARFAPSGVVFAVWAVASAVVVGGCVGSAPVAAWIVASAGSLFVGALIGAEFFVLRPRMAARKAEEAGEIAETASAGLEISRTRNATSPRRPAP